ncbi:MAG: hypothetical protein LBH18_01220 [Spirochaetaceae bacterium]|nr:hypothetical protein [Spirochaetaceae bacterium]
MKTINAVKTAPKSSIFIPPPPENSRGSPSLKYLTSFFCFYKLLRLSMPANLYTIRSTNLSEMGHILRFRIVDCLRFRCIFAMRARFLRENTRQNVFSH